MKAILTFLVVQTGCLMALSMPFLAYFDIKLWGFPGFIGMLVIVIGLVYNKAPD